jgi:hypothetical protein
MTDEIIIPGVSEESIRMYFAHQAWKEAHPKKSFLTRIISIFRK